MRIEFPYPLREAGGTGDIGMINMILALNERESNALPSSPGEFKVPANIAGSTTFFGLSTNEGSGNVLVNGFYEQPILGCIKRVSDFCD